MDSSLTERVAYGRSIRIRAECFISAHGALAESEAREAAREPGITVEDRAFFEAVADRIARLHRGCASSEGRLEQTA